MLGAPELDAGLQVGSHQSSVEGQNPLPRPAGHTPFDTAWDMAVLLFFMVDLINDEHKAAGSSSKAAFAKAPGQEPEKAVLD